MLSPFCVLDEMEALCCRSAVCILANVWHGQRKEGKEHAEEEHDSFPHSIAIRQVVFDLVEMAYFHQQHQKHSSVTPPAVVSQSAGLH